MPDKEPRQVLRHSRKEEAIIEAYEENLLEFGRIHLNDPREQIYQDIVVSKFGSYNIGGERTTPTPLWDFVFDKGMCPACNTPVAMVKGTATGKLEKEEESYVCNNCRFEVSVKLFDEGGRRNNRENEWLKKDAKLREDLSKGKLGKGGISELVELGERKAMSKFERMNKDEKD